MKHGTITGYNRGCHCVDCQEVGSAYYRAHRSITGTTRGRSVGVDVARLQAIIEADGISATDASIGAGLSDNTLGTVLRRGRTSEYTLDAIACYFGRHMSELEVAS